MTSYAPPRSVEDTPRKKKLRLVISRAKLKLQEKKRVINRLLKEAAKAKSVDSVIEAMKAFLKEDEHNLVAAQMRLNCGTIKQYPDGFKEFAICLYFKSPQAYRFLQTRFKLPAKSTIHLWLSQLRFQEGLCPNLLKLLAMRVKRLPEQDRTCSLIGDEISLKKAVEYSASFDKVFGVGTERENFKTGALVFMVAGLRSRWKQTVSFQFMKNALPAQKVATTVQATLTELKKAGLNVVSFCSDQVPLFNDYASFFLKYYVFLKGSNFRSAMSSLGVTKEKPQFCHDGQVVTAFADPPHLLKSTRNCLRNYKITSSKGTALWSDIEALFEEDRKGNFRLCPKLSDKHFSLTAYGAKMKVKWAAQVSKKIIFIGLEIIFLLIRSSVGP